MQKIKFHKKHMYINNYANKKQNIKNEIIKIIQNIKIVCLFIYLLINLFILTAL